MPDDADLPARLLQNSGRQVAAPRSTPGWSEPAWLAEWIRTPLELPPARAEEIYSAIADVTEWLFPPPLSPSAYFGPLARMFGLPDDWPNVVVLYDEALADLPDWALIDAVRNCVRHCRFFPKPVEIHERLPEQLAQMRLAKRRLEMARWRVEREQQGPRGFLTTPGF